MADFLETPRFPESIYYLFEGGPEYVTSILQLGSGREYRDERREVGLSTWEATHGPHDVTLTRELTKFFRALGGRHKGFRWKDFLDYIVASGDGELGTGVGTGLPTYQMYKIYTTGIYEERRPIYKPVSGTTAVQRNSSPVTFGAGAGNISIDTTTGIITFVADATSSASGITVGTTTDVVLASNPGTLIAGQKLYLTGFTGADAALVNDLAHTINSISGTGPYTFTLGTNTNGKTITLGSGQGRKYPQASETLTFTCEFDVVVRFKYDNMRIKSVSVDKFTWENVGIIEYIP